MKQQWIVIGSVVAMLCVIVAMKIFARAETTTNPKKEGTGRLAEAPEHLTRQEPVGWVFGRMVGFPGADRPLTGQPGSFGGAPLPPTHLLSK